MTDIEEISIDTKGMEDRLKAYQDAKFLKLEEMFTKKEETQALSEKVTDKPIDFDWKAGVDRVLRNFDTRNEASPDATISTVGRRPINEVAVRTYNEETKEHEYGLTEKLVESIGTIAQGAANCCIPEVWADKIERDHVYPGSVFLGAWFMNWYTDIENQPGDTVRICRVAPAVCTDMTCDEPTTTAPTIACPYITLEHDVCALAICKNDIVNVQVGLVDALTEGLGTCLHVCVDNYFFNVALSCANAGTLACTTPMSGSILLEAMGSMMAGTYTPVKVIMHPVVWVSLMQDTNFRYANQFGARDVVLGGRLEQAYGLEINVVPKGTLILPAWNWVASSTYRTLLLAKGALAGAMKYGINVETEYSPRLQKKWIIADIKYGGVCLHPDGIYWIHTVETGSC